MKPQQKRGLRVQSLFIDSYDESLDFASVVVFRYFHDDSKMSYCEFSSYENGDEMMVGDDVKIDGVSIKLDTKGEWSGIRFVGKEVFKLNGGEDISEMMSDDEINEITSSLSAFE